MFLNRADYGRTATVLSAISRFPWTAREPRPAIRFAGDAYLAYLLVDSIAGSQASSALAALAATLLIVWWMLRSAVPALLAVLPVAVSVVWNFGVMGWLGVPLGVATSMFCAIVFGVGIDFALHWIGRFRLGLARGMSWERALRFTARTTGSAILGARPGGHCRLRSPRVLKPLRPTAARAHRVCEPLGVRIGQLLLLPAAAAVAKRSRRWWQGAVVTRLSSPEAAT